MFGGGPPGDLDGEGAPRWKQRALYDALKDTAPLLPEGLRLARVATHDHVGDNPLGAMLDGLVPIEVEAVRAVVYARSA